MRKNPRSLVARGEIRELLDRSSLGPVVDNTRFQWHGDVLRIHYDTGTDADVAKLERITGLNIYYVAKLNNGKRASYGMRTSAVVFCETHARKLIAKHEADVGSHKSAR